MIWRGSRLCVRSYCGGLRPSVPQRQIHCSSVPQLPIRLKHALWTVSERPGSITPPQSASSGLMAMRAPPELQLIGPNDLRLLLLYRCDIGANLTDPMFQGQYHGKAYHDADLTAVLDRAWTAGVTRIIITATNAAEARRALAMARTDERLFCTVGVHPTRCGEFDEHPGGPDAYMAELVRIMEDGQGDGKVVAVGEFGLDYDRLQFCERDAQLRGFERQFELIRRSGLPAFLHSRAAAPDMLAALRRHVGDLAAGGVVHSFDGSAEEAAALLEVPNMYIGVNGCSLKTDANLAVVASLPAERLLLETDAPWCGIRPSHASSRMVQTKFLEKDKKQYRPDILVKGRNEPCTVRQVLEAMAGARAAQDDIAALAETIEQNTHKLFFSRQAASM